MRSRLTAHMLPLVIGALTLVAVTVGVVVRTAAVDHREVGPGAAVTSAPATPDPDAGYLRQICGSVPPTEGALLCTGKGPSISPSDLIIPGYKN